MFLGLAVILLSGLLFGEICRRIKLPPLIGMLAAGIISGPYCLDLIDVSILDISAQLRKIALIIILLRAGLSLDISGLKKAGRPAVLMCFLPACFEIAGMIIFAPLLLGVSYAEAAVMGSVVAAVSPAVVVPKMIKLSSEGYGTDKGIPELILAGASVDDVFVIVMFSVFTGFVQTGKVAAADFLKIPFSIFSGIAAGIIIGFVLGVLFKKIHLRDTAKIIIFMGMSFALVSFEDAFGNTLLFCALIGVMCMGISLQKVRPETAERMSARFEKLWSAAEIMLFVLVGACVNISYAASAGITAALLLVCVLIFRMTGVFVCLIATKLDLKEKLFCMLAYTPKATVQAAIGGLPLAMGLECGEKVLTVAVLSIIITAPVGAFLIDLTYKKFLKKSDVRQ